VEDKILGVGKGEVIFFKEFEFFLIERLGGLGILGFLWERLKVEFY
jgi:hypothetical protein